MKKTYIYEGKKILTADGVLTVTALGAGSDSVWATLTDDNGNTSPACCLTRHDIARRLYELDGRERVLNIGDYWKTGDATAEILVKDMFADGGEPYEEIPAGVREYLDINRIARDWERSEIVVYDDEDGLLVDRKALDAWEIETFRN